MLIIDANVKSLFYSSSLDISNSIAFYILKQLTTGKIHLYIGGKDYKREFGYRDKRKVTNESFFKFIDLISATRGLIESSPEEDAEIDRVYLECKNRYGSWNDGKSVNDYHILSIFLVKHPELNILLTNDDNCRWLIRKEFSDKKVAILDPNCTVNRSSITTFGKFQRKSK